MYDADLKNMFPELFAIDQQIFDNPDSPQSANDNKKDSLIESIKDLTISSNRSNLFHKESLILLEEQNKILLSILHKKGEDEGGGISGLLGGLLGAIGLGGAGSFLFKNRQANPKEHAEDVKKPKPIEEKPKPKLSLSKGMLGTIAEGVLGAVIYEFGTSWIDSFFKKHQIKAEGYDPEKKLNEGIFDRIKDIFSWGKKETDGDKVEDNKEVDTLTFSAEDTISFSAEDMTIDVQNLTITNEEPLKQYASGTPYVQKSGPAIVGERGSEIIESHGRARLTPSHAHVEHLHQGDRVIDHSKSIHMFEQAQKMQNAGENYTAMFFAADRQRMMENETKKEAPVHTEHHQSHSKPKHHTQAHHHTKAKPHSTPFAKVPDIVSEPTRDRPLWTGGDSAAIEARKGAAQATAIRETVEKNAKRDEENNAIQSYLSMVDNDSKEASWQPNVRAAGKQMAETQKTDEAIKSGKTLSEIRAAVTPRNLGEVIKPIDPPPKARNLRDYMEKFQHKKEATDAKRDAYMGGYGLEPPVRETPNSPTVVQPQPTPKKKEHHTYEDDDNDSINLLRNAFSYAFGS